MTVGDLRVKLREYPDHYDVCLGPYSMELLAEGIRSDNHLCEILLQAVDGIGEPVEYGCRYQDDCNHFEEA